MHYVRKRGLEPRQAPHGAAKFEDRYFALIRGLVAEVFQVRLQGGKSSVRHGPKAIRTKALLVPDHTVRAFLDERPIFGEVRRLEWRMT